ncbi:MAG: CHAD domain-containing protein [Hyphomicrobium sp.]
MAFRYKLREPVQKGFRRIAREQITRAITELRGDAVHPASVHQCRKAMKRLKAHLRLVRGGVSEKTFRAHYDDVSEIADLLAGARAEHVLDETIDNLEQRFGSDVEALLEPLRAHLSSAARPPDALLAPADAAKAMQRLAKAEKRFAKIRIKRKPAFGVIADGLEQTYRRARHYQARAYRSGASEDFHELRKAVQWHWRHMALIWRAWPELLSVRIDAAREISQILGDDHDLAMLLVKTQELAPVLGDARGAIDRLARARQEELREAAASRVARLFAESPKAFARRMSAYWDAARHMQPVAEQPSAPASDADDDTPSPLPSAISTE